MIDPWDAYEANITRLKNLDFVASMKVNEGKTPYDIADVEKVDTLHEGLKDGEEWIWQIHLKDGGKFRMVATCDYHSWECQSVISKIYEIS